MITRANVCHELVRNADAEVRSDLVPPTRHHDGVEGNVFDQEKLQIAEQTTLRPMKPLGMLVLAESRRS